ncbi:MAG: radical SAM protein [Proteobacteria bacterium]|nr:radical SAM protein [Pseudomonadota bacterium]
MREWTNPYNAFNSMKVLMWREHFEGIVKGEFLPPVTVDTDPTNRCNYKCLWCNAFDYMKGEKHTMSEAHLIKLADFYKEWGVRSTCVAGGGEPLMNPGTNALLERLHQNGVEAGVITNGALMTDEHIDIIARTCRWCGFSMDAGTPETYAKVKGIPDKKMFHKVIENIRKLTRKVEELGTNCDVSYKYLLHPINAGEIFQSAELAKSMGVRDFHLRPVGWDNISVTRDKDPISFYDILEDIDKQIASAMSIEDGHFIFFGIRHKFDPYLVRKINFSKCWATPLLATFGADGKCHLCFDMRGRKDLILCEHDPEPREILKVWGSKFHKDLIDGIDPRNCPRCTFGPYNEITEQVFIKDEMCRTFP